MSSEYPGEPLSIIDFGTASRSSRGNIIEFYNILTHELVVDRKCAVVSVVGDRGNGKSFLLNYCLRYLYATYKSVSSPTKALLRGQHEHWIGGKDEPLKGFSWENGTQRQTSGIVVWSDLFLYDPPMGEKIAILLIDSQGLNFEDETSTTDSSRILSLSALISSMQVFNLSGNINENDLQNLQNALLVLTKDLTSSEKAKPFQSIMFLVRDWLQSDDYDYGLSGGQEMLEKLMEEQKPLLEYVNKAYKNVSCFLLPPGDNVPTKTNLDGRWSSLDPKFTHQLKYLVSVLLAPKNLIIKEINKKPLRGEDIYTGVLQYAKIYQSGDIPDAKSLYDAAVINQMHNLVAKSMLAYNDTLQNNLNNLSSCEEIDELYEKSQRAAYNVFENAKKIGTVEQTTFYHQNLSNKIKDSFAKWRPNAMIQLKRALEHKQLMNEADEQEQMLREMKAEIAQDEALELLIKTRKSDNVKRETGDFVAKLQKESSQNQRDQLQRSFALDPEDLKAPTVDNQKLRELKTENERVNKAHDEALKLVAETKKSEERTRKEAEDAIETLREKNEQYDQRQKELEQQAAEDKEAQEIQEERICELMMEIERLENEAKEDKIKSTKDIKKAAKKLRKLKELLQEERDQSKKEKKKANWFKRHMKMPKNFLFCSADVQADFKFRTAGKPAAALLKMAVL